MQNTCGKSVPGARGKDPRTQSGLPMPASAPHSLRPILFQERLSKQDLAIKYSWSPKSPPNGTTPRPQQAVELGGTRPHSGSHCMGWHAGLAGYELCDFGQVISLCLSLSIYK